MFRKIYSVMVLCALLTACLFAPLTSALAAEAYLVNISVDFDENLIFSTYDVDLFTNSTEQAVLPHGEDYNGSFYLAEGPNTIFFYKHGNKGIKGKIELNLTGNTDINCNIHCFSDEVSVSSVNIQTEQDSNTTTRDLFSLTETEEEPVQEYSSVGETIPGVVTYADIDFSLFTDEELELAAADIKAEQRSRMKTKIVLSSTEETIAKGKTFKLSGEVVDIPEELTASKLSWSSSDKSVATYEAGRVTAVAPGTATIICMSTLSDGTEIINECQVTVFAPVTSITVGQQALSLGLKESGKIEYTIKPANASNQQVYFESEDPSVAIVSADGVVTPVGIGSTSIIITAADGSGISSKCKVKVSAKSEIGITRAADGIAITLTGMKQSKGNSLVKPESGNIFIIVDYTVSNESKDSELISYSSFAGYYDGYKLDTDNTLWLCDNYNYLDNLEPGRKLKGQFCVEVPSDWKEMEVQYSSSIWSSNSVSFMLYKQNNQ